MPEEKMVGEWALEWLEKQMQRGLSKSTAGSYRQWICRRIVPEFSDVALNELTVEQVQDFYESLAGEGLSQNSIWCGHLILRRLLDEAGCEVNLVIHYVAGTQNYNSVRFYIGRTIRKANVCRSNHRKIAPFPTIRKLKRKLIIKAM